MAGTLAAGLGGAAAALAARQGVTLWAARAAAPAAARKFYEGGFEGTMTRREAALILVRPGPCAAPPRPGSPVPGVRGSPLSPSPSKARRV